MKLTQKRINILQKEAEDTKNWILQQGVNTLIIDELVKLSKNPFEGV